ncbi:pancreatic triacylglycerol lipase-like isoform X2 [Palaemon carinicauda]|uniref:pancreatic triacylglycerol lipase-like isoform X2 n=1 Tax=Palaemon carinicauda TaxID=392227 RepID=UPI0035B58D02
MLFIILTLVLFPIGETASSDLSDSFRRIFKADMDDVHFLLWTRSNSEDASYYELNVNDITNIVNSPFNPNLPTHLLIHGWMASGQDGWAVQAKTELLKHYECNIISVDWEEIARHVNYYAVVNNLPSVGEHVAMMLDVMHIAVQLNITTLHVTGHSLGAHISGIIGQRVVYGPLGRITGLDPAAPNFHDAPEEEKLDKSDAAFVEVIHTNAGSLLHFCVGLADRIGHVDYYPNGGEHQPGCTVGGRWKELLTGGCSHGRSFGYWIESINGMTPFRSKPCSDWYAYETGNCSSCGEGCLDMGLHASTQPHGTYFLETDNHSPFALG